MANPICTNEKHLVEWLSKLGVNCHNVYRVVIDMRVGQIPRIVVEEYGTETLLQIDAPDYFSPENVEVLKKEECPECVETKREAEIDFRNVTSIPVHG